MPELPEVETIRRTIFDMVTGRTIRGGEILYPKMILPLSSETFLAMIENRPITDLRRRGKYLLFDLGPDLVMAIHLRMTGQLLVAPETEPVADATYLRVILDNRTELRFRDQRKFGKVFLFPADELPKNLAGLGPEPLGPQFTADVLQQRLTGRTLAIKKALLDQSVIAGVGNIYADESLFVAGIHPARTVNSLTGAEVERLFQAIRQVLAEGIEYRGTTRRDYHTGDGKAGSYQQQLRVYGRKGLPCRRCGGLVVKMNFGGRGTHFCPLCQS